MIRPIFLGTGALVSSSIEIRSSSTFAGAEKSPFRCLVRGNGCRPQSPRPKGQRSPPQQRPLCLGALRYTLYRGTRARERIHPCRRHKLGIDRMNDVGAQGLVLDVKYYLMCYADFIFNWVCGSIWCTTVRIFTMLSCQILDRNVSCIRRRRSSLPT